MPSKLIFNTRTKLLIPLATAVPVFNSVLMDIILREALREVEEAEREDETDVERGVEGREF